MLGKIKLMVFCIFTLIALLFYSIYVIDGTLLVWGIVFSIIASVFLVYYLITVRTHLQFEKHIRYLTEIVGVNNISVKDYEKKLYSRDSAPLPSIVMMLFKTTPDVIIKVNNENVLSKIFVYAQQYKIPLTLAAGKTSLMAGAVPLVGGIVLDLMENEGVIELDEKNLQVTVRAATVWNELLNYLELRGYTLGTYPTSAPASTVGGWISTGGIGIGSFKNGGICDQIVDLKILNLNGEIFHTNPLKISTNVGYNLNMVGVGTEGTLGLVLEATLNIQFKPEMRSIHTVTFDDQGEMLGFINDIIHGDFTPFHIEWKDKYFVELLREIDMEFPKDSSLVFLVLDGGREIVSAEIEILKSLTQKWHGEDHGLEKSMEEWNERFYPMRVKRLGPNILGGEVLIPTKNLGKALEKFVKTGKANRTIHGVEGVLGPRTSTTALCDVLVDERNFFSYLTRVSAIIDVEDIGFELEGRNYTFNAWNAFYMNRIFNKSHRQINTNLKKEFDNKRILQSFKTVDTPKTVLFGFKFRPFIFTAALNMLKLINNHLLLGTLLAGIGGFLFALALIMPAGWFTQVYNLIVGTQSPLPITIGLIQPIIDVQGIIAGLNLTEFVYGLLYLLDFRILNVLSWLVIVGIVLLYIGIYFITKNTKTSALVSWVFIGLTIVWILVQ